ncbi:MAG: 50S ribosomal protein L21 [Candidatus Moeniiplasma glomeromycotorum]|nr:50S ribosomal protein L21 [Candidatus Moeniiplasma glomeromycotorum]MCE8167096.1 50S ribosomal protein L21 [Candidatus Moeniiplasma glomeromycotorum]MCE8168892.1 50S ribosomal protein L21 [Candidatus Moeniiplasma glomeromycotorum]
MSTIFEKGEQIEYSSSHPKQIFRIDYQKKFKVGDIIKVDQVLKHGEEFGQPYLEGIIVSLKVVREGLDKKLTIVKKKAKKRYQLKKGYRAKFTKVQVIGIEDRRQSKELKKSPDKT